MSSNGPKFPEFFEENNLMVVLDQIALKSDTIAMVRSYAHVSEQLSHLVISGSKTNSNFRRKTNLAGTSTVRVCNSASPRCAG